MSYSLSPRRVLPLLLAAIMLVTGCATGDISNLSPAQQAIEQSKRRVVTTTAEGAVGGALLGALVGGLTGGRRGALIGAAAGGVLGGGAGYAVGQNNVNRTRTESDLNTAVANANQEASEARQDAARANEIATEARTASARLGAQYRAGQINASQYRASLASYRTSLGSLQEISKGYGEQITQMRSAAGATSGSDAASLRASSGDLASSKAAVDRAVGDLTATLQATPS